MRLRKEAMRRGRDATLAKLRGEPTPPCPYRPTTKSYRWYQDGAAYAARLVARILEIGA